MAKDTASPSWQSKETCDVIWEEEGASGRLVRVNEYHVMSALGRGSFGEVLQVERRVPGDDSSSTATGDARKFALKVLSRSRLKRMRKMSGGWAKSGVETGLDMLRREIAVQENLFHRNVVLLFEILDDLDESDNIGLVLELCSFGPVMDFIEADCRFHPGAHARLVSGSDKTLMKTETTAADLVVESIAIPSVNASGNSLSSVAVEPGKVKLSVAAAEAINEALAASYFRDLMNVRIY
jgi:hypothetical protein